MNKFIKKISVLILLFSITSCLSISSKVPEVKDFHVAPEQKKVKIFAEWYFESRMIGGSSVVWHRSILNKFITESNCCIIVDTKEDADIYLKGKFNNKNGKTAYVFAVITGASMYTIPSWINVRDQITATANKNGKIYEYNVEDSMITAQWLPFIVALPFQGSAIKKETKMMENMYKTLLVKMRDDGLFNK